MCATLNQWFLYNRYKVKHAVFTHMSVLFSAFLNSLTVLLLCSSLQQEAPLVPLLSLTLSSEHLRAQLEKWNQLSQLSVQCAFSSSILCMHQFLSASLSPPVVYFFYRSPAWNIFTSPSRWTWDRGRCGNVRGEVVARYTAHQDLVCVSCWLRVKSFNTTNNIHFSEGCLSQLRGLTVNNELYLKPKCIWPLSCPLLVLLSHPKPKQCSS